MPVLVLRCQLLVETRLPSEVLDGDFERMVQSVVDELSLAAADPRQLLQKLDAYRLACWKRDAHTVRGEVQAVLAVLALLHARADCRGGRSRCRSAAWSAQGDAVRARQTARAGTMSSCCPCP